MIESHKLASLALDYTINGSIPLYINYLNDNYTILFNITQLLQVPKHKQFTTIKSNGYERTEEGHRFLLPLSSAYIYKNNALIKKPLWKWTTTN